MACPNDFFQGQMGPRWTFALIWGFLIFTFVAFAVVRIGLAILKRILKSSNTHLEFNLPLIFLPRWHLLFSSFFCYFSSAYCVYLKEVNNQIYLYFFKLIYSPSWYSSKSSNFSVRAILKAVGIGVRPVRLFFICIPSWKFKEIYYWCFDKLFSSICTWLIRDSQSSTISIQSDGSLTATLKYFRKKGRQGGVLAAKANKKLPVDRIFKFNLV